MQLQVTLAGRWLASVEFVITHEGEISEAVGRWTHTVTVLVDVCLSQRAAPARPPPPAYRQLSI